MKRVVPKSQFKPHALRYFREVEQTGKEIIVTDRGKPVLKVVPYSENPEVWLKPLRGSVLKYRAPMEPVSVEDWGALQ
jgi:prevent-host-death family protein